MGCGLSYPEPDPLTDYVLPLNDPRHPIHVRNRTVCFDGVQFGKPPPTPDPTPAERELHQRYHARRKRRSSATAAAAPTPRRKLDNGREHVIGPGHRDDVQGPRCYTPRPARARLVDGR